MRRVSAAALLTAALLGSACASGDTHAGHTGQMEGTVPGAPADAAEADREIVVEASDELSFDPDSIEVEAGETVTFVVRNVGSIVHEFVLGDSAYQEAQGDMGGHMHSDNGVTVAPGETAELTWRFDEAGEVMYGCHEAGHYDGGMVGSIDVS